MKHDKELVLSLDKERRVVVEVFDDGNLNIKFSRMANWVKSGDNSVEKDWISDQVYSASSEEMKTLGETLIRASQLLVLA